MRPTKLIIRNTGTGAKSVLEDLPAVLKNIEHWHQGSVANFELQVFDATGNRVR